MTTYLAVHDGFRYLGHGSGGNADVPNSGGNGLLFHLGPIPPSQYTGSASSWGNGLDVTFRTYNSTPPAGVDIAYNPVSGSFSPGAGTVIAKNSFISFFQTNGTLDSFSEALDVSLGLGNGALTVACSNASIGNAVVYTNLAIPGFTNISPGYVAFTATEGAGAHEDAWIDNVSISLNPSQVVGPVVINTQPSDQSVLAGSAATFTVGLDPTSSGPLSYQWWRINPGTSTNTVMGATNTSYTTPDLSTNDSGAQFFVVVTGALNTVTSAVATVTVVPQGAAGQPVLFSFDDGQIPAGSVLRGNNAGLEVASGGGFNGTGCLILTRPGSGQTYGQWVVTNDLAGGVPVSSFNISFMLYMGHGSGGDAGVPNSGGNGLVLHLGPTPPNQFTGSDSSWGNGLDVSFRTYGNSQNNVGLNLEYNAATNNFNAAGTGTLVGYSSFFGYFRTNGAADNFSEAVDVWMSLVNGKFNLVCSNALIGNRVIYTNYDIPSFVPISPCCIAFTATDGGGAHEDAWIDNVSINLNSYQPSGPVVLNTQPASQISHLSEPVTFSTAISGTPPLACQWSANGVPIAGATGTSYTTPPVVPGMSGTVYSVTVSNTFGSVTSSNATLRVLPVLPRTLVWGDEFNGPVIDSSKWARQGDYTRQQGYWIQGDAYLNGQGQLVLRVMQDPVTGHYGSGAVFGKYLRTFGYFEAKVKFPIQQGHWCAFWVYSDSEGNTNVIGGADGAEIDIMEKAWLTDHIQDALHWDGYSPSPLAGSAGLQVLNMGMNDGGWHIFAMDWTPTNYTFYVDGTQTWSTNAGGVSQVPSYVILSEEVGNFGTGPDAWGTGPISNAVLPDYYLVDYVRVYDTNVLRAQLSCPMLLNVSNVVVSWTGGGILQSATNATGPWAVVTNAVSPYTNLLCPDEPRMFFRVQQ